MKTRTLLLSLILTFGLISGSSAILKGQPRQNNAKDRKGGRTEKNMIRLFNGKDLSNWVFYLKDPAVDPAKVFQVTDGMIHIKGDPFGYMRTRDSYSDYKLHLEYRWPVEATNSGVFIHSLPPDTIWIKTFECQLKAGNAGDFVCMNGASMNEKKSNSIVVAKKAPSSEKPVGEWNTVEVICNSDTIEVYINGVLQNKGTGLSHTKGHICLQSEGRDIQFKNVYLTKLPKPNRK